MNYDKDWAKVDVNSIPDIKVPPPGPKSKALHDRAEKHMKGYSSQVRFFPVAFESGHGVTMTNVDGNTFHRLLFRNLCYQSGTLPSQSSGIYSEAYCTTYELP
ncbi:MAG: hypothetical protein U5N58_11410 [Actinomycetota bacterium]|nr:hypothetical protein [Actinomycetota bacterium]